MVEMAESSRDLTLVQLLQRARADVGSDDVVIEFSRDVIQRLVCPSCGGEQEMYAPAGKVRLQGGRGKKDGHLCTVVSIHGFSGSEDFGYRRVDHLGLALVGLFLARSSKRGIGEISY